MNKYSIFVIILVFSASSLLAFNWTKDEISKIDENEVITVLNLTNTDKDTTIILQDKNNNVFEINYPLQIDDSAVKNILKLKNDFFIWPELKINKLKFTTSNSNKLIEISILPSQFICKASNIIQNIPDGLYFTYTDALQYNFRIVKNDVFIRLQGYFVNDSELCDKINNALANPTAYIKKRDPEYFSSKLDLLQGDLDKLRRDNTMLRWALITLINDDTIDQKAVNAVIEIKKNNEALKLWQIRDILKEKYNIKLSKGKIKIIIAVYFNEFED